MFEITLPYPPSVNHYWRHVGPRTLISRQGLAFRQEVEVRVWRSRGFQRWQPLVGPLDVEVLLYPPDQRRRDIDNALKSLLDALGHARVYEDDSQVTRLTVERRDKVAGGQCAVRIRPYEREKENTACS